MRLRWVRGLNSIEGILLLSVGEVFCYMFCFVWNIVLLRHAGECLFRASN